MCVVAASISVRDTARGVSHEDIEGMREGYELMSRRDFDAVLARVHHDFVYENDPDGPLSVTFHGKAA
jgi:ketosteroid isomerase-like protein